MLNDKERKKYEVIEKVMNGTMKRKTLIIKLDKSSKTKFDKINLGG